MLRKLSITLNALVVAISLSLFAYTFFAKIHIASHAEKFLVEKTLVYSAPIIDLTKSGLSNPIASKFLSSDNQSLIKEEISSYEANPVDYIRSLTGKSGNIEEEGKVAKIKNKIINYYDSVLEELIIDLRIFSGSNLIAGLFCLFVILSAKFRNNTKITIFSIVVFISVALSSYGYLEGLSFFRILFKWNMGWSYPMGIIITIGAIYADYTRQIQGLEEMEGKKN